MSKGYLIFLLVTLMFLPACGQADNLPPTSEPVAVTLTPGLTAITGLVVSPDNAPLGNTEVHLANVAWNEDKTQGAFYMDTATSPVTVTAQNGVFYFANVTPTDYVIVIGDLYGQNVLISNPDGTARIFTPIADQALDVGLLEVDLQSAPPIPNQLPTTVAPAYPGAIPNNSPSYP
ncbi:MAG: carboxypeptidase regulatory-like domain-containing protein [Chloroflexi bacterium]|nr:carboxypeptidase regulatory-like domain-containing protein [Chloroflexota bacterium]